MQAGQPKKPKTYLTETQRARKLSASIREKHGDNISLAAFMSEVKPTTLDPYKDDIDTLIKKGYSISQVITYLSARGLGVTAQTVRKFIREGAADK